MLNMFVNTGLQKQAPNFSVKDILKTKVDSSTFSYQLDFDMV